MFFNPRSAGGCFEIVFQGCGFFFVFQPDGGFYFPGAVFGGVFGLAVVMGSQAGFQIRGEADVGSFRVTQALEEVDIHGAPPELVVESGRR